RHYVLDDGRLTDHVAAVDLSAWGRAQPGSVETVVAPPPAVPAGSARPPEVELVETPSAERHAPVEEESGDDTIFRRPRNEPG
ncbi:MAG: hypothetical protein ACJ72P_12575, partial [Nocardioides sp.]